MGYIIPMKDIKIRNVPDEIHRKLKVYAADRPISVNQLLLDIITALVTIPSKEKQPK